MSDRREQRVDLALPVKVSGMDANGKLFEQEAGTVDVTTTGARLSGIVHPLHRGCIVSVQRGPSKARFRVVWVGEKGGLDEGQIGVQLVDAGKLIWGQVIPRIFGDRFRIIDRKESSHSPIPLRALTAASESE